MDLLYKSEHLSCPDYACTSECGFHVLNLKRGELLHRSFPEHTVLLLILKGELSIFHDTRIYPVKGGTIFLAPKNVGFYIQAEDDTCIVTCLFSTTDMNLCNRFSLQQLQEYINPQNFIYDFNTLTICPQIHEFAKSLINALNDGLGCIHYHRFKREELMLYLRAYYTKQELAAFFYPIIGQDMDFKDFILNNYKSVRDVKEFAQKANLSVSTFNRRFKQAFSKPANQWMTERRSESILRDILMTNIPFALIAEKHAFSSPAYLVTFCKKHYGRTPNDLRKNGLSRQQSANPLSDEKV